MPNFQKVYLRVVGRVGDTSVDPDKLPDRVPATGQIFLKPNIKDGWAEQTVGPDGIEELMVPAPITCTIEDGWMTYNGDPFVWLVVGDENWNWNISFPQVRIAGVVRKIDAFNFDLTPATAAQYDDPDYQGVNLALEQEFIDPDTGNKAVRGPRGWTIDGVTLVGTDQLAFSLDDPLNTTVSVVTIPAVTQANTARDDAIAAKNAAQTAQGAAEGARDTAIGARDSAIAARDTAQGYADSFDLHVDSTTTLPPGSAATVTVDASAAPSFGLTVGVPQGIEGPQGPPAPDATTGAKGIVQLAGDLAGTAVAPVVGAKKITAAKIADDTITAAQIAPDAIGSSELADNAVDTNAIQSKAVTAAKIADDTITASQIAPNAVNTSELADSSVTSAKIADGTIVDADISDTAAIKAKKTLVPASFSWVPQGGTRAAGNGDFPNGFPIFENFTITQIIYYFGGADQSGSTTLKLQRNRGGTIVDIVGTSQTITAANQADGTATDPARTFNISDATGVIQSGDRIIAPVASVGTTPGKLLGVWVRGYYN